MLTALSPLDHARACAGKRHLCFLDRAAAYPGQDTWTRVFSEPEAVFTSREGRGSLTWAGGFEPADGDPFRWLDTFLAQNPGFTAAGYWGYDLRRHVERLSQLIPDDLGLPDCWLGLYGDSGVQASGGSGVHAPPPASGCPAGEGISPQKWGAGGARQWVRNNCQAAIVNSTPRAHYESAVRRVLDYVAAGDCYQVNLSHRLSAPLPCPPWDLYERLRAASPAPYAAYLDCGGHQVLSSSPELFLRVRDREVETRPIKGTRPRGWTPEEDAANAAELLSSPKDRAELLMIVDLERNDLGRVCEYGSVRVPELYALESYSSVHHLVATVRGRLRPDVGPIECLRAAFPGGSITGAPKIRAMEIIEELEPVRRGPYTGAIGWVDGRGNAEWNIAIRTMVVKDGRVYFHVGGGIVADSDPAAEYEETLAKAQGMLGALGSVRRGGE